MSEEKKYVGFVHPTVDLIQYQKDAVVSMTLIKKKVGTVTVFAFDKGQGLSEHSAPFDAMVQVLEGEVEIVIGNRMLQTKTMPSHRYWTNRFTSWIVSKICKQEIPDTQCGYRLIKTSALAHMELISEKYDIDSEMLIQAAQKKLKIISVPIQTIYGDEVSEINPLTDTIRFFKLIFKHHLESKDSQKHKHK